MKPKVLLCCGHAGFSGVPIYVASLARALTTADVFLVSDVNEGVFDDLVQDIKSHTEIPGLKSNYSIAKLVHSVFSLRKLILEERIDLIWAHSSSAILAARIASFLSDVKLVVTYHGVPFGPGRPRLRSLALKALEFCCLRVFNHSKIIAISEWDRELLLSIAPRHFHALEVVNNVVSLTDTSSAETGFDNTVLKFIAAARVSKQKNLEEIPKLLNKVNSHRKITMSFYGEGTDNPNFVSLIRSICKNSSIEYLFYGEQKNWMGSLQDHDIYISTSHYEGFSLSMSEAVSSGLALVTSNVGGVQELSETVEFVYCYNAINAVSSEGLSRFANDFKDKQSDYSKSISTRYKKAFSFEDWSSKCRRILDEVLKHG